MAEIKTKLNAASVTDFLESVANEGRRADAKVVLKLMKKVTGKPARMWGGSIVGFDQYHYQYASGHEGEMCMLGFSPRAGALTLYLLLGYEKEAALLEKLGKHKRSKGCLYINKLADVDLKVLEEMMREAYALMQAKYPQG
jgi:hypothetical protein